MKQVRQDRTPPRNGGGDGKNAAQPLVTNRLLSAAEEVTVARRIEAARAELRAAALRNPLAVAVFERLGGRAAQRELVALTEASLTRGQLRTLHRHGARQRTILRCLDRAESEEARRILRLELRAAQDEQLRCFDSLGLTESGLKALCSGLTQMGVYPVARSARAFRAEAERAMDELQRARARYRAALGEMTRANLGLVTMVAKRYLGHGLMLPDLIQEGSIGCLRAAEKFDLRLNCKFSTYAMWWIQQAVRRALTNQSRTIRLPVHVYDRRSQIQRTSIRLAQALGHEPTDAELAQAVELPSNIISALRQRSAEPLSLAKPTGFAGQRQLGDTLADHQAHDPSASLAEQGLAWRMRDLVRVLTPREAQVITMRFGLSPHREHTLQEVAAVIGVSRERVRQLERQALAKLRRAGGAEVLRDWL